jgi:Mn-dependent DtxR family transcriptional regulator
MSKFSTREAAKKLGIDHSTLAKYVEKGKIAMPETVQQGKRLSHLWSEEDIEKLRKLLPKIANGRKTRYSKPREKQKPPAPVPHKQRIPNKKRTTKPPKANG